MGAAPQCMLVPTQPQPSAPDINLPSIPVPNGNNTQAVLSALRATVLALTNQNANNGNSNNNQNTGNPPTSTSSNKLNQFKVISQVVSNVKVYDPNDSTGQTYVTVAQVTSLQLQDPVTNTIWSWSAPASVPNP